MGKSVSDTVLDGALSVLKTTGTRWCACSTEPTSYAEATSTYLLADVSATSSDYTIANGDTNGRKITMAAKNGITIDATGNCLHMAIVDSGGSALLYVTTTPTATLSTGLSCNFGAWKIEIADPT